MSNVLFSLFTIRNSPFSSPVLLMRRIMQEMSRIRHGRHMMALLVLVVVQTALASPASTVLKFLPESNAELRVERPTAVVCDDGATWLLWWQGVSYDRFREPDLLDDRAVPANLGIFGRLIAPSGRDILAPKRLVAPKSWVEVLRSLRPALLTAEATPDGSALLVLKYTLSAGDADVESESYIPEKTALALVQRNGHVTSETLDADPVGGLRGICGTWSDVNMLRCWGRDDVMHLLLESFRTGLVYASMRVGRRGIEVLSSRSFVFPLVLHGKEKPDVVPTAHDYLNLVYRGWTHADMIEIAPETLLIGYAPPGPDWDDMWGDAYSGDTLVFYRVHSADMALIDSVRLLARSVAGVDYEGFHLTRAHIQTTPQGMAFAVPTDSGSAVFLLDHHGAPVIGPRHAAASSPSDVGAFSKSQTFSFGRIAGHPWRVDWFGFDEAGGLCHLYAKADSIPGRTR